ncbi:MAG: hypothetical protein KGL39_43190 [Patescibacteria group bacterium]|nr:hypothetical protein [Patescibacteria group bacterium]
MSRVQPGVCRHCNCTETNACRLEDGDPCCWTDLQRTVCSNPACIRAESARVARARQAAITAGTPRKLRSWEIHEQIRRGRRGRKRRAA